jgi:glycine betaine/proline transport system substrate-binding protein
MEYLTIKRGYQILPDNSIKFGIRVTNTTDSTVSDVEAVLDYSESLFNLDGEKISKLGNIPPGVERTAKFILKPSNCIHKEEIGATVLYKDSKWEHHVEKMKPKEIDCVCPFLKEKPMKRNDFLERASIGQSLNKGINFKGLSPEKIISYLTQTCKNSLYKVDEYAIRDGIIIYFAAESVGEQIDYLLTAFVRENDGLTQVLFKAVSDEEHGLNGFLNEIIADLQHLASTTDSAQEIGVIKKENVINIKDSVVQRSNFNIADDSDIDVKDSLVQRTNFDSMKLDEKSIDNNSNSDELEAIDSKVKEKSKLTETQKKAETQLSQKDIGNNIYPKPKKSSNKYVYASILVIFLILGSFLPVIPHSYTTYEPYITTETYYVDEPYETTETETYYEEVPVTEDVTREKTIVSPVTQEVGMDYDGWMFKRYIDLDSKKGVKISGHISELSDNNCDFSVMDVQTYNSFINNGYKFDSSMKLYVLKKNIDSSYFSFVPDKSDYYVFYFRKVDFSKTTKYSVEATMDYSTTETTTDTVEKTREVPVTKYKEVPKTRQVEKERRVTKSTHISLFEMFV